MKTSQKGFIVPLLIIIVLVLVVAAGVYIYQKNQTNQTASNVLPVEQPSFPVAQSTDVSNPATPAPTTPTQNNIAIAPNKSTTINCGAANSISKTMGFDAATIKVYQCFTSALLSCTPATMTSPDLEVSNGIATQVILGKDSVTGLCKISGPDSKGQTKTCEMSSKFISSMYSYIGSTVPSQIWLTGSMAGAFKVLLLGGYTMKYPDGTSETIQCK